MYTPVAVLALTWSLLVWCVVGITSGTRSAYRERPQDDGPIVAVWAHPSDSSIHFGAQRTSPSILLRWTRQILPECGGECEYVKAAYVKWLESAGVRSLPVPFDATPETLKPILDGVNGVLFPGGKPVVPDSARWAIEYAAALNEAGDFFPVWGTCLGWEWMAEALAGDYAAVTEGFDAENITQPLGLLSDASESRMFASFPPELLEKASTEPLATNAHRKGVSPFDFSASGLNETFRTLAINADRQGRMYISSVEAFESPMYGIQWHPEKSQFDWGLDPDGTPHRVTSHSADAVKLSQLLASFFASETRRNGHVFPSIAEWEPKMFHNLEVTATGPGTGQRYLMHWGNRRMRDAAVPISPERPFPNDRVDQDSRLRAVML